MSGDNYTDIVDALCDARPAHGTMAQAPACARCGTSDPPASDDQADDRLRRRTPPADSADRVTPPRLWLVHVGDEEAGWTADDPDVAYGRLAAWCLECLLRDIGRSLVARGQAAVWRDVFRAVARGLFRVEYTPGAELRFLRGGRIWRGYR
jgi:hypothetical protein